MLGYRANQAQVSTGDLYSVYQTSQALQDRIPNLVHLRAYGCRAYADIPKVPRLQKLAVQAHIGYLVGYDSTNIFRLWIRELRRVSLTRDVTFDETRQYDPTDSHGLVLDTEQVQLVETISIDHLPMLELQDIDVSLPTDDVEYNKPSTSCR